MPRKRKPLTLRELAQQAHRLADGLQHLADVAEHAELLALVDGLDFEFGGELPATATKRKPKARRPRTK